LVIGAIVPNQNHVNFVIKKLEMLHIQYTLGKCRTCITAYISSECGTQYAQHTIFTNLVKLLLFDN